MGEPIRRDVDDLGRVLEANGVREGRAVTNVGGAGAENVFKIRQKFSHFCHVGIRHC